jgi:SAM-dependent methyltransferase
MGMAYAGYFTHQEAAADSLLAPRTLPRRLRNDYLAARFGYALPNREPFGRHLLSLLPVRRRRYDRLVRNLDAPKRPSRLLDVGSGTGEFLLRMRDLGWQVMGQDVDPKAAEVVRRAGIECLVGPIESATIDDRFDVITLHHVVEHLHDPVRTLSACRRLLAPGGLVWLATPHAGSFGFRRFGRHWLGLDCPRHLILFSRKGLDSALARAGFDSWEIQQDVGSYGTLAAAADLRRRDTTGMPLGRWALRAENLVGDAVELFVPALRDELVVVARA